MILLDIKRQFFLLFALFLYIYEAIIMNLNKRSVCCTKYFILCTRSVFFSICKGNKLIVFYPSDDAGSGILVLM
jgi:hypothetical protein